MSRTAACSRALSSLYRSGSAEPTAARMSRTTARRSAACARVTRSAARAASSPSRSLRTWVISMASSREMSRTRAPRLRWNSTSPCADSSCSAARAMNRDVLNRSHRSVSISRWLGAYSPCRMAARTSATTETRGSSAILVIVPSFSDGRSSVGVERLDCLEPPRLTLGALGLGPRNRLPVRREYQPGHRIGQLDPVPAWLVQVQEERLLDGVLVRAGLDEHAAVQRDVGGAQDLLAGVGGERDVVQPPAGAGPVVRIHQVVGLLR